MAGLGIAWPTDKILPGVTASESCPTFSEFVLLLGDSQAPNVIGFWGAKLSHGAARAARTMP